MTLAHTASGTPQPNMMTFADLEKVAIQLGEEAGKGNDTRVKFQMKLVEASFYNAVDLDKDKHGADKDDATVLTEKYVKARQGTSLFDAKAANQRKEISCARTAIKVGQWPHGGPGEPLQSMNNLLTTWTKERAKPENKGVLDDASNTLMKWARTQMKRDSVMDRAELRDLCFKKQSQPRTTEQRLEAVRKELQKISKDDSSSHITLAAREITKRLEAIALEKKKAASARATKNTSVPAGKPAAQAAHA